MHLFIKRQILHIASILHISKHPENLAALPENIERIIEILLH